MQRMTQTKGAAPGPIEAAPIKAYWQSTEADCGDSASEPDLLQPLRDQFARHGMRVSAACGAGLVLTGGGFAPTSLDLRSAWVFLRQLQGRAAA